MAISKGSRQLLLLEVAMFILLLKIALISAKRHVHIISGMGAGETITAHCASKDDDLGVHVLSDGQEFQWSFHVNIIRSTLFYCNVSWRDITDFQFNAFYDISDRYECSDCRWLFAPEGIYRWSDANQIWVYRYPWRP